ncbi:hypothetical protein U9M48_018230 [Paspalum notatum var. saurae]|uniref:Uncharacterized protein n=1 Tax=Paspalum notatum var. saurae TaxID=547442 RepID=A0AAQ3WPL7_PASNO
MRTPPPPPVPALAHPQPSRSSARVSGRPSADGAGEQGWPAGGSHGHGGPRRSLRPSGTAADLLPHHLRLLRQHGCTAVHFPHSEAGDDRTRQRRGHSCSSASTATTLALCHHVQER